MKTKFLYTNGRDVVVTQSTLQTKKALYPLKGITEFGLAIVKASRLPGLIITILGLAIIANADLHFVPAAFFDFLPNSLENGVPDFQVLMGVFVSIIGIASMILVRKRYGLRIVTAEGDTTVVVSARKEYVDQIVQAIRKARLI